MHSPDRYDDIPTFQVNELKPSCGPACGGTKLTIHGNGFWFKFTSNTHTKELFDETEMADEAHVRFMQGEKILISIIARVINSSKIECITPPYTKTMLESNPTEWGKVTIAISVHGSPYTPCKEFYRYYVHPNIFHVQPPAISHEALTNEPIKLSMLLSIASTPQSNLSNAQRIRVKTDMQAHPLCFRIISASLKVWIVLGTVLADDPSTDGVACYIHLPNDLPVSTFTIQVAYNGVDYTAAKEITSSAWTDWSEHARFLVFPPPQIHSIAPLYCFYVAGQRLTFTGTQFISYVDDHSVIIRFDRINHGKPNFVPSTLTTTSHITNENELSVVTPRFTEAGYYSIHISLNGGVHFTTIKSSDLLVYYKPCCEYLTPEYGVSLGGTELDLRLSFWDPHAYQDHANVALEETDFEDRGTIHVRFSILNSSSVLQSVRGAMSSCRRYIQCKTPRNHTVETFRYSQTEVMMIQLSFDGIVYFDLHPKKPFSYYAPPRLHSYATPQGPITGGTRFHIHLIVPIPDSFKCSVRFRGVKLQLVEDLQVTKSNDGLRLSCITPPWPLDGTDGKTMAIVELTLNGFDYLSNTQDFEPCQHPLFQGYEHHFLYYDQPHVGRLSTKYLHTRGGGVLYLYGTGLNDYGGIIQVAFSNGETTKYVDGNIHEKNTIECKAPPFSQGSCHVSVTLNGQQFTGEWGLNGHCMSCDPDTQVYFIEEPIFTALAPSKGSIHGNTELRIFGEHFIETGQVQVKFSSTGYMEVVNGIVSSGVLQCKTPSCPFPQRVQVEWSIAGEFLQHKGKIKPNFIFE